MTIDLASEWEALPVDGVDVGASMVVVALGFMAVVIGLASISMGLMRCAAALEILAGTRKPND